MLVQDAIRESKSLLYITELGDADCVAQLLGLARISLPSGFLGGGA